MLSASASLTAPDRLFTLPTMMSFRAYLRRACRFTFAVRCHLMLSMRGQNVALRPTVFCRPYRTSRSYSSWSSYMFRKGSSSRSRGAQMGRSPRSWKVAPKEMYSVGRFVDNAGTLRRWEVNLCKKSLCSTLCPCWEGLLVPDLALINAFYAFVR